MILLNKTLKKKTILCCVLGKRYTQVLDKDTLSVWARLENTCIIIECLIHTPLPFANLKKIFKKN